ncbi:MAG: SMC-Scp complex subunit ScpB [Phycisphaeraceae bacterium]|nr:SMC-Scp complex subunit ScpB [Phycisphaeraceae bacterium]
MSDPVATAPRARGRKAVVIPPAAEPDPQLTGAVEALLFSVTRPLGWSKIAAATGLIGEEQFDDESAGGTAKTGPAALVHAAIARLNETYDQSGRAFRIEQVAGGYRVMTRPEHAKVLERFHGARERGTLSRAAIETLAIIAYKQPITRAGLEAIRGVACGDILRALIDRRFVTITGRAEELGRPILYGTTRRFLEVFGLSSLKDLPTVEELRARARAGEIDPADQAEAE